MAICFSLGCNEKRDAEDLKKAAIDNEKSFQNLVDIFTSSLPDSTYTITFRICDGSSVDLTYYRNKGNIADKKNHFGGQNLNLHSTELDNVMKDLGWTYETIDKLIKGLKAIQCDCIRNTDWSGSPINVHIVPSGFVNSDYNIYPIESLDILKAAHGEPIGQSDFFKESIYFDIFGIVETINALKQGFCVSGQIVRIETLVQLINFGVGRTTLTQEKKWTETSLTSGWFRCFQMATTAYS